jgi:hypothetical protein
LGIFKNSKINDARATGGGVYFDEGSHEVKIVSWKSIQTRQKETALVVDFQVLSSTNESHRVGSIRNFYAGETDDMFSAKVRNLLMAAAGVSDSLDAELAEKTDWDALLDTSVSSPVFIDNLVRVEGVRILKKDAKKAARADSTLLDDAAWFKKNSFVRVDFMFHEDTRNKRLEAAKGKK